MSVKPAAGQFNKQIVAAYSQGRQFGTELHTQNVTRCFNNLSGSYYNKGKRIRLIHLDDVCVGHIEIRSSRASKAAKLPFVRRCQSASLGLWFNVGAKEHNLNKEVGSHG